MVLPISLASSEGPGSRIKESRNEGATGMSFVWGCCFHASFQVLGNPDVRCRSHSKIRMTGLSVVRATTFVVRQGWLRQHVLITLIDRVIFFMAIVRPVIFP